MLIPLTVHVPEHLVPKFYADFGHFVVEEETPTDPSSPKRLESGAFAPAWVDADNAFEVTRSLWTEMSLLGQSTLLYLSRETGDEPRYFRPDEVAEAMNHPRGASGIAGILGGVGKAIRRAELPMYVTPKGDSWHYVWDWDGEFYIMTPEVASLLKKAHIHRSGM